MISSQTVHLDAPEKSSGGDVEGSNVSEVTARDVQRAPIRRQREPLDVVDTFAVDKRRIDRCLTRILGRLPIGCYVDCPDHLQSALIDDADSAGPKVAYERHGASFSAGWTGRGGGDGERGY